METYKKQYRCSANTLKSLPNMFDPTDPNSKPSFGPIPNLHQKLTLQPPSLTKQQGSHPPHSIIPSSNTATPRALSHSGLNLMNQHHHHSSTYLCSSPGTPIPFPLRRPLRRRRRRPWRKRNHPRGAKHGQIPPPSGRLHRRRGTHVGREPLQRFLLLLLLLLLSRESG